MPHTLVLSPGLRIEKVYVGYWFWGRPTNKQLWTDIGEILQRTKADFDPTTAEARAAWNEMRVAAEKAAEEGGSRGGVAGRLAIVSAGRCRGA